MLGIAIGRNVDNLSGRAAMTCLERENTQRHEEVRRPSHFDWSDNWSINCRQKALNCRITSPPYCIGKKYELRANVCTISRKEDGDPRIPPDRLGLRPELGARIAACRLWLASANERRHSRTLDQTLTVSRWIGDRIRRPHAYGVGLDGAINEHILWTQAESMCPRKATMKYDKCGIAEGQIVLAS